MRIGNLKGIIEDNNLILLKANEALDLAMEMQQEADIRVNKWYRHPALWVTIGVVLTIAVQVGGAKLFEATQD